MGGGCAVSMGVWCAVCVWDVGLKGCCSLVGGEAREQVDLLDLQISTTGRCCGAETVRPGQPWPGLGASTSRSQ